MPAVKVSAYLPRLCGSGTVRDAADILARSVATLSGAWAVGVFLLDYMGRNLVLTAVRRYSENGLSPPGPEIPVDDLEDPLCYCVHMGKPVQFQPYAGMLPESLRPLVPRINKGRCPVTMYPLIAPRRRVIGALVCLYQDEPHSPEEQAEFLCFYGSSVIDRLLEQKRLEGMVRGLKEDIHRIGSRRSSPDLPCSEIVGISQAMQAVRNTVMKVAATDVPIFITGETGTGKSLIARVIHQSSNRSHGPFLEINCGAIPPSLLESELFGHKKGAFSGATADYVGLFRSAQSGTVFLDEIGEMPVQLQSVLLHVLQEHKVRPVGSTEKHDIDVRIIAATNKDLESAMQDGSFRLDLYHRLALMVLSLPSLAERREDIIPLAGRYFRHFCQKYRRNGMRMSKGFLDYLFSYDFTGNVRELSSIIERAVMLSDEDTKELAAPGGAGGSAFNAQMPRLEEYLGNAEKQFISSCFSLCNNDAALCANILGVHPKTLSRKFRKYGLNGCTGAHHGTHV